MNRLSFAAVLASVLGAASAHAQPAFDSVARGATLDSSIGTTPVGDTLMLEIGGESVGLRTFGGRRWLVQWDALLAARGGFLANEHPFLFLMGVHALAWAEAGYRFNAQKPWSPYLGARLGNEASVLANPDVPLSSLNSVDGVGGAVVHGAARVEFGTSFLAGGRSLLLVAFVEEALRAPEMNTHGQAFTQGGIGARFDLAKSLTASLEGVVGVTPFRADHLRGLSDQTTHLGVTGTFRKMFPNGMWIAASALLERDTDQIAYAGGRTYDTGNAPTFGFSLRFGVPLWRTRR